MACENDRAPDRDISIMNLIARGIMYEKATRVLNKHLILEYTRTMV